MKSSKYTLLLNSELKNHILTLSRQEQKRYREKLEFLENGLWDAGVRVKKLKGVSRKVIFEARLSRSDRLLFTLGRNRAETTIYLWGISGHDDVSAAARKILPRNAPFLDFEPEIHEDFSEIIIDDLSAGYFSDEIIEKTSQEDFGPQKWLVLSDEQWKRILLSSKADSIDLFLYLTSEQQQVLRRDPPLLLAGTAGSGKTTIAVYYLLRKEFLDKRRIFLTFSPFLKKFSERIYDSLVKNTDQGETKGTRPDFYVFRDLLTDIMKGHGGRYDKEKEVGLGEFERIFRNHRMSRKYDAELVWEEIRSIIKGAKSPFSLNRYKKLLAHYTEGELTRTLQNELKEFMVNLLNLEIMQKVERLIENRSGYASYDDFLLELDAGNHVSRARTLPVLEGILRILEKKSARLSDPLLTFQEYTTLGKKRAPNFLYDRREIYSIAEYYQEKLEAGGLWDEIDLCKSALQLLRSSEDRFAYDLVVCDEIQDFSDIQLSLIFRLTRNPHNVFLTGDPKQIINPSGFRWEEVKNRFYDRGIPVPDLLRLNLNFRCVGNIVKLSNALLDLKQRLVGLSDTEMREDWKFNGRPPFLLHGMNEKEVINGIRFTGAGQIILARDRLERDRLKKILKTELVFTINEAKGLEFDTVFLWKIAAENRSSDLWRKILDGGSPDRKRHPHVRHELNLFYVAVTRARNTLVIYEGEEFSRVWDIEEIRNKLYPTSERAALSEVWQRASTPEEWKKQGDYFFEREYYPAAMECYKNSGNLEKKELAQAFLLEGKKRHTEAARLFEKHRNPSRAAENYEKSHDYERAMLLWKDLGKKERANLCRIGMYETQGRHNEAAREWKRLGDDEKALENWDKAGNLEEIARHHLSRKHYEKAAAGFEKAKQYEIAASCYKKAKKFEQAADLYFRAKDYQNAAILFKKLKHTDNLLRCHLSLEDYHSAALVFEKNKDIEKAIEYFSKYVEGSRENRALLKTEASRHSSRHMTLKAALRYSALSMYEFSASFYFRKGYVDRAIEEYRILGDHCRLAECLEKKESFYEAAVQMEKADTKDKWETVTRLLKNHVFGSEARHNRFQFDYDKKRADILYQEAEAFLRTGSCEKALARFRAIRYPEGILQTYLKLGRNDEAIRFFTKNGLVAYAGRYLQEKPDVDLSLDLLKELTEKYSGYDFRYDSVSREDMDFMAQAFSSCLNKHKNEEILFLIDDLLSPFRYYYDFEEIIPDSLLNLALASKSYNTIFRAAAAYKHSQIKIPEKIQSFFDAVRAEADKHEDRNLLASYCFLFDKTAYELILKDLPMTSRNYMVFSESKSHYRKTVDYLLGEKKTEEAAALCRIQKDYGHAARIYEKGRDFKSAGRDYREAKMYGDALRCYRKVNDYPNVARVYERMKDFENAMKVWFDLGKTREVNRVRKKMETAKQKASQDSLF